MWLVKGRCAFIFLSDPKGKEIP